MEGWADGRLLVHKPSLFRGKFPLLRHRGDSSDLHSNHLTQSRSWKSSVTQPILTFLSQPDQRDRARIRYEPLLTPLKRQVPTELIVLPNGYQKRKALFQELSTRRVIVLPAHLYSEASLALIRRHSAALILDLDDAIFCRPPDTPGRGPSKTRSHRFEMALEAQDAVVTAGPYLRETLRQRASSLFIRLIPNPLEVLDFQAASATESDEFRLLWIGSRSTLCYLESILPALQRFAEQSPGVVLTVVSDAFPDSEGPLKIEHRPWSLAVQNDALGSADVGLMPLDRRPWSRGKSGYKLAQYMGAGLPAVSSREGNGQFLVGDNYPFFAETEEDWLEALRRLREDAKARRDWGSYLQAEAQRRFDPRVIAKSWSGLVDELRRRLEL